MSEIMQAAQERQRSGVVETPMEMLDTGVGTYLDSYAGGGASEGAWGSLTLRTETPGEPDQRRDYIALGAPYYGLRERSDSRFVKHALREIALMRKRREAAPEELRAQLDPFQEQLEEGVLTMIRVFSAQRHSGSASAYARQMLGLLLQQEPLGVLYGTDEEWSTDLPEDPSGDPENPRSIVAQNVRCSRIFRLRDGTVIDVEALVFRDTSGEFYVNSDSRGEITFPYDASRRQVADRPREEENTDGVEAA